MLNGPFTTWPSFSEEEADAVRDVLLTNKVNYWTGQECREFEREFAAFASTEYAIALANGTVALDLAFQALGVGLGDEVIVTSRTFLASVSSIVNAGAVPVFADVDPITKRPKLLKADYFHKKPNGNDIDFTNDYMVPFYKKFESVIRKSIPNAVIFAEPHINIIQAWKEKIEPKMPNADRFVWVPHYYDLLTLLSKSFRKWIVIDPLTESISFNPIQVHTKMMLHQLEKSKGIGSGFNVERRKRERESSSKDDDDDDDDMLGSPALVGETGICFDQYNGEAYHHTLPGEIMPLQTTAYDSLMQALDLALASVTLWNYSPNNSNLHGKKEWGKKFIFKKT